ncbi:MAG: DUF5052 family protein [Clostridia bacterium]|nr:DUF5052 family protein [Clostridia bacterium]
MKKVMIISALVVAAAIAIAGCQSFQRSIKDLNSEITGLNRKVSVYDQNGNLLREYTGRIDIAENEYGNKVKFDINGKRVILYNAIVVVEEQ